MIKYPIKKKNSSNETNYSKRGMAFEDEINITNEYYLSHDIAVIYKKPTPIKVVEVNYPSRSSAMITKAFYSTPSTTDYNGVYKGKYIDFETKQINSTTSLPLSMIHNHQLNHLIKVHNHGAISFILVYFAKLDIVYLLETSKLLKYYERAVDGKKSISIEDFELSGYKVEIGLYPRINYLDIVDKIINNYQKEIPCLL